MNFKFPRIEDNCLKNIIVIFFIEMLHSMTFLFLMHSSAHEGVEMEGEGNGKEPSQSSACGDIIIEGHRASVAIQGTIIIM